jgi:hypothetical protein
MSNNNNKRIENEATEIKSIIKETQKDTCLFLLVVLESIINEQVTAKQLKHEVGSYIYQAVKDQATRKGWIES